MPSGTSVLSAVCRLVAIAAAGAATGAGAKITDVFTISDYQPSRGGFAVSSISSVAGSYTTGTTAADYTSNVTVGENSTEGPASYTFTGRVGSGWSQQSAYTSDPYFKATFDLDTAAIAGRVSTNVPVSLSDFVFGGTGTVTVTDSPVNGVPEPAAWGLMLAGFGVIGTAQRTRRRVAQR